jgi:hypothetical protein
LPFARRVIVRRVVARGRQRRLIWQHDMQKNFGFEASSVTSNARVSFQNFARRFDRDKVVGFLH